jgi:hypothetical protein
LKEKSKKKMMKLGTEMSLLKYKEKRAMVSIQVKIIMMN